MDRNFRVGYYTDPGGSPIPVCPTTLTEVEREEKKMQRPRARILYHIVNLGIAFSLATLFGCSTTRPNTWHPKSRAELVQLIGQTTMEAIHQYSQLSRGKQRSAPMPPNESLELYLEQKVPH